MQKVTDRQIAEALINNGGIITSAACALGLSREQLSRRVNATPKLQAARMEAREVLLDMVESVLIKKALSGNTRCLIFFLSTQGRSRGYGNPRNVTFSHTYTPRLSSSEDVNREMREALGLPPENGILKALGLPPE